MRNAFAILLGVHALVHVLGALKAFGLARLPQLGPISRPLGAWWLAAAALLLAAAVALLATPRWFWLLAALGVVVSQVAIMSAWRDARFGTVVNVLTLFGLVYAAFAWGPFGLRAEYDERVSRRLVETDPTLVTEADLAPLPGAVQRYLRFVGVVGQPRVRAFRARFRGRIRSAADAPWMPFTGEQHNWIEPATRLFWMEATMRGLPVDGLHAYDAGEARMRVKLLSLIPVVDAGGPAFTRTETVTVFNDRCIMAPATLIDPEIGWKELDAQHVAATFRSGPHSIAAVLVFDARGALIDFWSDDRPSLAPDGVTFVKQRWSTPVGDYRSNGPLRLASRGEARYAAPSGEYAYIQFDALEVSYEPGRVWSTALTAP